MNTFSHHLAGRPIQTQGFDFLRQYVYCGLSLRFFPCCFSVKPASNKYHRKFDRARSLELEKKIEPRWHALEKIDWTEISRWCRFWICTASLSARMKKKTVVNGQILNFRLGFNTLAVVPTEKTIVKLLLESLTHVTFLLPSRRSS